MSLLTAEMVEAYADRGGRIGLVAVFPGQIDELDSSKLYEPNCYTKEEQAVCEDLMAHRWPLPGRIKCPWEELRTLSEIETSIIRYLRRYIWFRNVKHYTLVADWVISTYFRDQLYYAPILIIDGLTMSGKSTAIYAISQICYRGELFDSASGPAIAREIEDYGTTILLDEVLDGLAGDRGVDLYTMLKSSFSKEGVWVRADPKGRKNYRYRTYTNIALSIKGDTLPEDLYNRAIRINMTAAPPHVKLQDIYNWREDDSWRADSPDTIRTDLYRLAAWTRANPPSSGDGPGQKMVVSLTMRRAEANRDVTQRTEDGRWLYAYVNGLPDDSPMIRSRDRNIANTLYAVALETGSGPDVIAAIVENSLSQKEVILDTPEALTFISMLELVEEGWEAEKGLMPEMTGETFRSLICNISTTDVAARFNLILGEQGNQTRDPVATKTITAKLAAMGFKFSRIGGHGYNKSWLDGRDKYFADLFLRYLQTFAPDRVEVFKRINTSEGH